MLPSTELSNELPNQLSSIARSAWRGQLEITYAHKNGETRPIHVQTQAPLRVQRPHYPEGPSICYSTVVHTAGGIVGGDELIHNIHLQSRSQALITTPAATKVYRSAGPICQQTTTIQLDSESYVEWLPQETIVFNAAKYHQKLRVNLESGASALIWEITRFGRTARGECFDGGDWRSDVEVWQGARPLLIDRQHLPGNTEILRSPHGLNGSPVVGTFAWVGVDLSDDLLLELRCALQESGLPARTVGLTRGLKGVICRYRGSSSQEARRGFVALWRVIRQFRDGKVPPLPRLWY